MSVRGDARGLFAIEAVPETVHGARSESSMISVTSDCSAFIDADDASITRVSGNISSSEAGHIGIICAVSGMESHWPGTCPSGMVAVESNVLLLSISSAARIRSISLRSMVATHAAARRATASLSISERLESIQASISASRRCCSCCRNTPAPEPFSCEAARRAGVSNAAAASE